MSDSELHICKARKGANFSESFYSTNEDCESDDLTGIPGKAYLFQPRYETNSFGTVVSHCEKVAEYENEFNSQVWLLNFFWSLLELFFGNFSFLGGDSDRFPENSPSFFVKSPFSDREPDRFLENSSKFEWVSFFRKSVWLLHQKLANRG